MRIDPLLKKRRIALASPAESEVRTDHNGPGIEAIEQHFLEELGGGPLAEGASEGQQDGQVDSESGDALDIEGKGTDGVRNSVGRKRRCGMPIEGNEYGRQPGFASGLHAMPNHRLMSQMNAVERANADD
ncbi:MAG: hypothetical protein UZ18_ATM001001900 [Armatimonadetes bacterium OLB18]|nr:MAG: hypothetical protein UZ18_ATM001001900 [Armatimonadetes bacterium OLB18]